MNNQIRKTLILCVIGTILEWYDFAVFASMIPVLSKLFFPHISKTASLLATFSVFATGFLVRPFGGALFGYIGDRFGRKISIVTTLIIMSCSTALIGLLPTYQEIGIMAAWLLVVLRIFQGLSSSGEHTGTITFLSEIVSANKKFYLLSWGFCGVILGMLLGSVMAVLATSILTQKDLLSYGWRMLFLFGFLVGGCGLYLRLKISESTVFQAMKQQRLLARNPVVEVIQKNWIQILIITGMFGLNSVVFYSVFVYVPAALVHHEVLSHGLAFAINGINILIMALFILLVGWLADKYGWRIFLKTGAIGFILLSYPLFLLINSGDIIGIIVGQCVMGLLNAVFLAPTPAIYTALFSDQNRYSGIALGINLSAALFGGTAPLIMGYLTQFNSHSLIKSMYVIGSAIIALICVNLIKSRNLETMAHTPIIAKQN